MNRLLRIIAAAAVALTVVMFAGCQKEDEDANDRAEKKIDKKVEETTNKILNQ